ncbi:DUF4159 domain-containing protein [Stella sp.]|uniref:DUF4159 domain-containing protein n=1 Tax=Stella sp. TaxID=2912054 RepID=UPI0035AE1311
MLTLGALAFAAPWALAGLAALPVLWWLLRVTPPAPRRVAFPAIRLLLDLRPREETPAKTPLWLILLRMLLAALAIVALAQPLLNPQAGLTGSGPLVLVVDDGWAAARHWRERQAAMADVIDRAERAGRRVLLLTTAPLPGGEPPRPAEPMRAADARLAAQALAPRPWPVDRAAATERVAALRLDGSANVVWLADGLDGPGAAAFGERLQRLGGLQILLDEPGRLARLALPPRTEAGELMVPVRRATDIGEDRLFVRATAEDGRLLAREEAVLAPGRRAAEVRLDLPLELRNRIHRVEIEGENAVGGTVLVDERWRRRPVGVAFAGTLDASQPLLSDLHYLQRALQPFAEVRIGPVAELLRRELAVIALPDSAQPTPQDQQRLQRWIEEGGVLLRFAGPTLAQNPDPLVPVTLRRGDRQLGGALSWSRPAPLAEFDAASPFAGIPVPKDVTVERQVLAEPALDLNQKSWAKLADGTPIVTGEQRGRGWLALVHTTANTEWSNLALSGLFVAMLQRVVAMSEGVASTVADGVLPPLELLDGFARPQAAAAAATAIPAGAFAATVVGPRHPPGFYGTQQSRRALNLTQSVTEIAPLAALPAGAQVGRYGGATEIALRPWLLVAAFLLALVDLVIGYALRGLLRPGRLRPATAAAVLAGLVAAGAPGEGAAQRLSGDEFALRATTETRLASVRTGNPAVDATSRAGLGGLSTVLSRRTSIEAAEPMEVDLERDELAFFPLLYWPVTAEQPALSPQAVVRVNTFLKNGGTILFDTQDQGMGAASAVTGGGMRRLRQLAQGLQIGTLAPVPPDHVLTKAFYLMQDFPGRFAGGQLWVEQIDERVNDGVASVIIGSNDWAAAWAVDPAGRASHAVVPGGERQREMAYRFGVNLVTYALTGNYKADQVHVPAILERLGQ